MSIPLTPTQHTILTHAHQHTQGKITWFPDNIKGGARQKVIDGLFKRALISSNGPDWFLSAEGYAAIGVPNQAPISDQALDNVLAAAAAPKPRVRDGSKQAQVIAMLLRPEGATITQICAATGWQPHTVRGTFAGSLKNKLGLQITSTKEAGSERIYRAA